MAKDFSLGDIFMEGIKEAELPPPPKSITDFCQISVPVRDSNGTYIGERGVDLYGATPDELMDWAAYICPSLRDPEANIALRKSLLEQEKQKGNKITRDTFFNLAIEKHKGQLRFPKNQM